MLISSTPSVTEIFLRSQWSSLKVWWGPCTNLFLLQPAEPRVLCHGGPRGGAEVLSSLLHPSQGVAKQDLPRHSQPGKVCTLRGRHVDGGRELGPQPTHLHHQGGHTYRGRAGQHGRNCPTLPPRRAVLLYLQERFTYRVSKLYIYIFIHHRSTIIISIFYYQLQHSQGNTYI